MTSAMALSLLQDAQTRGLAAALAGIKREEVDRNLTMSPPMNSNHHHHHHHNQSPVYTGFNHAATAFGMLSPSQLMNRTAAALMAAQLPKLASVASLFPHHPALFGTWRQPSLINGPHSPPASPISPITSQNSLSSSISLSKKLNNNNNNNNMTNNNNIGSTTTNIDIPVTKKTRKISMKKELMSPPLELPISNSSSSGDIYNSGPISPPSSGSSPNSQQGDVPVVVHHGKDPSRDKSFTCKICNRSFGYKHVLQNHERTHTGEKPFECPECHKRFTRDHHLKTHMRLHTGEKPYHCSHCDRQFVQVANLRRHLRVHTGEKPYPCDICKSRFSDSNQLKSHILIHNGEKPFECDRCHLEFRRRHHLMNHKCGIQSPPTPAISPAISDYGMSEQKSTISSSFASDESILDLNKSTGNNSYDDGAILSVSGGGNIENEKRSRKSTDIRRVVRLPQQIIHVPTTLPEQTEPEDLSIRSPRSLNSPNSSHHDDDLEDLDDAMTLHFKQQHQLMIQNATAANVVQHIIPKWHTHMEQD